MQDDEVVGGIAEEEAELPEGAGQETEAEAEGCPGCCAEGGAPCCRREGEDGEEGELVADSGEPEALPGGDTGETPVPPGGEGEETAGDVALCMGMHPAALHGEEETAGDAALRMGMSPAALQGEEAWPAAAVGVVGLCFRKGGKVYYFGPGEFPMALGDFVVVETDRGVDIGEIVALKARLEPGEEEPTRQLLRPASTGDVRRKRSLEARQEQAFKTCERKINELGLEMKLIDASYTLDGKRLTFAFVSEARVDFRDLVRDLAQTFRCRIELRQVGVRDQAKLIGGLGPCGRPLCCATFLRDFCSVGIRLAKDQGLSLNPTKISGACDRLMCCLRYEHAQYSEVNRRLPRMGERVEAGGEVGDVIGRNLLTGAVTLRTQDGREVELAERDLFPEGIKVAIPASQGKRREEGRGSRERRPRQRGERRSEAPKAPAPGAEKPAEAPGEAPATAGEAAPAAAEAKAEEAHRSQGRRSRGPRHRRRRKPGGQPGGQPTAPAGGEGKPEAG